MLQRGPGVANRFFLRRVKKRFPTPGRATAKIRGPMMSMRSQGGGVIRVALIGYGRAGRTFHTPLIRSTPGFDLAAVVSSRPAEVHADLPHAAVAATPADVWTDASV